MPSEVSLEDAQSSARSAALAMFAALRRELGSLDAIRAWARVDGFVNADAGYRRRPP
ncbi:hypothetical protein [Nocardia puris]|uniref:Uncharacterized protein n=1 Tax=Nocardia puris TaxID=208602 RepID=A0A366CZ21_9NOCA|nr:hypothetical protein [Nocardia puris]RBO82479.1 hypothetical protein DFR74_12219 [Nocardia puris]